MDDWVGGIRLTSTLISRLDPFGSSGPLFYDLWGEGALPWLEILDFFFLVLFKNGNSMGE